MSSILKFISSAHLVQAIIIGGVFAYLTAVVIINARIKAIQTTVNGWSTSLICGRPGNGLLTRAASAKFLPGVNAAEEAMYWICTVDDANQALNGKHDYILHFPAGQLPPNEAFWSLTITDTVGYMVPNAVDRQSLGDRSALEVNSDGSIDLYIQQVSPAQHESNWLPAPAEKFRLTLRVYLPGPSALAGRYTVPPVVKVR